MRAAIRKRVLCRATEVIKKPRRKKKFDVIKMYANGQIVVNSSQTNIVTGLTVWPIAIKNERFLYWFHLQSLFLSILLYSPLSDAHRPGIFGWVSQPSCKRGIQYSTELLLLLQRIVFRNVFVAYFESCFVVEFLVTKKSIDFIIATAVATSTITFAAVADFSCHFPIVTSCSLASLSTFSSPSVCERERKKEKKLYFASM